MLLRILKTGYVPGFAKLQKPELALQYGLSNFHAPQTKTVRTEDV